MIITNSRYALVGYFITSYPTRAHGIIVKYSLAGDFPYPMGAVYIHLNNSFIKRPITHDYTDLSSSLGVSDKDLCTNSQTVFTGKFPSATVDGGFESFISPSRPRD